MRRLALALALALLLALTFASSALADQWFQTDSTGPGQCQGASAIMNLVNPPGNELDLGVGVDCSNTMGVTQFQMTAEVQWANAFGTTWHSTGAVYYPLGATGSTANPNVAGPAVTWVECFVNACGGATVYHMGAFVGCTPQQCYWYRVKSQVSVVRNGNTTKKNVFTDYTASGYVPCTVVSDPSECIY